MISDSILVAARATLRYKFFTTRHLAVFLLLTQVPDRMDFGVLCREVMLPKAVVNRCVSGLVMLGFVERERNDNDNRKVWLGVTPDGWRFLKLMGAA